MFMFGLKRFKRFLNHCKIKIKDWNTFRKIEIKDLNLEQLKVKLKHSKYLIMTFGVNYIIVLSLWIEQVFSIGKVSFIVSFVLALMLLNFLSEIHHRNNLQIFFNLKQNEDFNKEIYKTLIEIKEVKKDYENGFNGSWNKSCDKRSYGIRTCTCN